jgi:hypothetical protein
VLPLPVIEYLDIFKAHGSHLCTSLIPQHCASLVNAFCAGYLNPYANFHRPCFFPETITDAKGKERKRYRYQDMKTPYEKFKSLPNASDYLKPAVTFVQTHLGIGKY